jgi:N-acetylglucosaminyldiphosphoundecaprenol N-acetyl-beta-D-mannosaminyltransferase
LLLAATARWNLALRLCLLALVLAAGFVFFFSVVRVLMRRAPGEEIPAELMTFGMKITPVSMTEAIERIDAMIATGQPHHVVTCDANAILRAQEDPEYAAIVRRAAMITPDGYGVMWGARLLNLPIYERVTGIDMVEGTCAVAARKGYSIYILGSEPGIAARAAQNLQARHPGLVVAGTQHGFFSREGISEEPVAATIAQAHPDVLFVAFGIPKQEKFIAQHFATMKVPVSMGVGGSFDVYSEKLKRAPVYIQRAGLEWVYRVWIEPWRWKRMGYVPRFMLLALRVWLFGDRNRDRASKRSSSSAQ